MAPLPRSGIHAVSWYCVLLAVVRALTGAVSFLAAILLLSVVCSGCRPSAPSASTPYSDSSNALATTASSLEANARATISAARATIAAAEVPTAVPSLSPLPTPQIATITAPSPPAAATPPATAGPLPSPSLTLRPTATTAPAPRITFVGPDYNIWVMNSDGSDRRPLLTGIHALGGMSWSPDCSRIAFTKDCTPPPGSGCSHIVIARADGTGPIELGFSQLAGWPNWSPDGAQLIYTEQSEGVFLVNPDGKNRRFLTKGLMPAWSPDGSRLVYSKYIADKGVEGIFVINIDGGSERQLTAGTACGPRVCGDLDPDWSPDGRKIIYASGEPTYVMDADGWNRVMLVEDGDDPKWSPDGTQIAFARMGGDGGVYVMKADGTDLKRIGDGAWPAWLPCASLRLP